MSIQYKPRTRPHTVKVELYPGDGTMCVIEVACIRDYPRNAAGQCAFCLDDPLAIRPESKRGQIGMYYLRNPDVSSCPCCRRHTTPTKGL